MRVARAMLSSGLKTISGARRRWSARPTRERRCSATLASPSNVTFFSASEPITLTNTLACRKSRVTSQPVTVTSREMRGSLASFARNSATSSRMASARRSARREAPPPPLRAPGMSRSGGDRRLEGARDRLGAIALDHVANLDVVEVFHRDAALEAFAHLADVVLEALERRDRSVEDLDAVADDAHATLAIDHAAAHRAARDGADARDLEHVAHFGFAADDLALFRTKHAFHRRADVRHRLVDDAVQLDVDAFAFGRRARIVVRAHVKADDDRAGAAREQNVRLGDGTDAAMHDVHLHFAGRQADQCVGECFRRAALVRLDDDVERVHAARGDLPHEVFQRDSAARAAPALRFAIETFATLRDFACRGR